MMKIANGRILRETPFDELYVHQAAGDGGGAVGAALFGYHMVLGKPRQFVRRARPPGYARPMPRLDAFRAIPEGLTS